MKTARLVSKGQAFLHQQPTTTKAEGRLSKTQVNKKENKQLIGKVGCLYTAFYWLFVISHAFLHFAQSGFCFHGSRTHCI